MESTGGGDYLRGGHRGLVGVLVVLLNCVPVQTLHPRFDLPLRDEDNDGLCPDRELVIRSQLVAQNPLTLRGTEVVSVCDDNEKVACMPSAARCNLP